MSSITATRGSARLHRVVVRQYKPHELDCGLLAQRSIEVLGKNPFDWRLDACVSILCGQDVILDVRTGNGKTLVFSLPLLTDPKDVNIIVSPLSALMIDQVNSLRFVYILVLILNKARSSSLPTVAVCSETIAETGKERLFEVCPSLSSLKYHPLPIQSIVSGSFLQVIVSPEILISAPFRAGVLSKTEFTDHLRAVVIGTYNRETRQR
jgi:superfamily II DNA helicase RecQ